MGVRLPTILAKAINDVYETLNQLVSVPSLLADVDHRALADDGSMTRRRSSTCSTASTTWRSSRRTWRRTTSSAPSLTTVPETSLSGTRYVGRRRERESTFIVECGARVMAW